VVAWLDDVLEDVRSTMLDVQAGEPLQRLAGRLGAMLSGSPSTPATLGPADDDVCLDALADADALLDPVVASGDVVVLCDALAALLTSAIRERGAHAVWFGTGAPVAGQAWGFLRRHGGPADAYVLAGRTRTAGMLAVIPAADLVTAKAGDRGTLTWSSVLADVLERDHDEHVGGRLHARPQVAAR
jgi:hypothetical protein